MDQCFNSTFPGYSDFPKSQMDQRLNASFPGYPDFPKFPMDQQLNSSFPGYSDFPTSSTDQCLNSNFQGSSASNGYNSHSLDVYNNLNKKNNSVSSLENSQKLENRLSPRVKVGIEDRLSPRVKVGVELTLRKPEAFSDVRSATNNYLRCKTPILALEGNGQESDHSTGSGGQCVAKSPDSHKEINPNKKVRKLKIEMI